MEYTVGSVADLISGSTTPNKPSITKKPFKRPHSSVEKSAPADVPSATAPIPAGNKKKVRKQDKDKQADGKRGLKATDPQALTSNPELDSRTIFVGNLPNTTKLNALRKYFRAFGEIDSLRIRGVTPANPKMPKRVAYMKGAFHPKRSTLQAYIRYKETESAVKATVVNGVLFNQHHLRVNLTSDDLQEDPTKAIFIGNLKLDAEDEDLWRAFESCGSIRSVRIIRDKATGIGKGFAYVNFCTSDSVQLALEMGDVTVKGRILRISMHAAKTDSAKKGRKNSGTSSQKVAKSPRPKFEKNNKNGDDSEAKGPAQNFQGAKSTDKKKKKKSLKGALAKKILSKRVMGETKKPNHAMFDN